MFRSKPSITEFKSILKNDSRFNDWFVEKWLYFLPVSDTGMIVFLTRWEFCD